jgi:hypothetical protein
MADAVDDALQLPGEVPAASGQLGTLSFSVQQLQLEKPTDCFWLLQCGAFWACSSSAQAQWAGISWRWTVQLPIMDPAQVGAAAGVVWCCAVSCVLWMLCRLGMASVWVRAASSDP